MESSSRSGSSFVLVLLLPGWGCGSSPLKTATSDIQVAPLTVDFGNVYVTATPTRTFTVFNSGEGPDMATLALLGDGGPFTFSTSGDGGSVPLGPAASVEVTVGYSPVVPGGDAAQVGVSWSNGSATVTLQGTALAWPPCVPEGPCETVTFNPNAGTCTQNKVPDSMTCDGGDVCLIDTACADGQCLGMLNPCNDRDACTTDYCVEGEGCHHDDNSAMCEGQDPCQIYSCDPVSGCTSSQAPDGTPCSTNESCQTAQVCVAGACLGVAVPNGAPCALPWAPCVSDATCQNGTCDSPTADAYTPGQPLWHLDLILPEARYAEGPFAVDDAGTSYVSAYELDAGNVLLAIDHCGHVLWGVPDQYGEATMLQNGQVFVLSSEEVVGYDAATGAMQWTDQLLPLACAAGIFDASAWTLSNQGSLSVAGYSNSYNPFDAGSAPNQVLTVFSDGALDYLQQIPGMGSPPTVLLADRVGNTYFSGGLVCPQTSCVSASPAGSFDATGALRFTFPEPEALTVTPLAVGADYVLVVAEPAQGAFSSTISAYGLDGTHLYDSPTPLWNASWGGSSYAYGASIDAAGTAYLVGQPLPPPGQDPSAWEIEALDRQGNVPWTTALPAGTAPLGTLVIGDPGTLFMELASDAGTALLSAWSTADGGQLWQTSLGTPALVPEQLSLSSSSELLSVDPTGVTAYFANKSFPAVGAPWPQVGGDATSRFCAAP